MASSDLPHSFVAAKDERLDLAITSARPDISRRGARRLIEDCGVLVNSQPVRVVSRKVRRGDRVTLVTTEIEVPVIASATSWIAVNKPFELATQPTRDATRVSLIELLAIGLKREGIPEDLFVVHRLDVGTSGVIVFARDRTTAARLSAEFAAGTTTKSYLAMVAGTLQVPLELSSGIEHLQDQNRSAVSESGKSARTLVTPLKHFDGSSLVELSMESGRTHQIRVHLAEAGHPILGDPKYAPPEVKAAAPRLMLHAWTLTTTITGPLRADPPDPFPFP